MNVTPTRRRATKKLGGARVHRAASASAQTTTTVGHAKEPPAVETSNATKASLTPAASKRATTPLGRWALSVPKDAPSVAFQIAAFKKILRSGLPGRADLVATVIKKRSESAHAYYRGIADSRTRLMAKMLPARDYPGGAGFVLSTGDMHLFQPATVEHETKGVLLGIGDSDRIGFGPYEWDIRSLLVSIELEGRERGYAPELRQKQMRAALREYRECIESVASAGDIEDQEVAAKELRVADNGDAPAVLSPTVEHVVNTAHDDWLDKHILIEAAPSGKNARALLRREPGVVEDVADVPPGAAAHIKKAIAHAMPDYARQLPDLLRSRVKDLAVVDLVMPVKGNGSLGYGRWQVLLADPKDPTDRTKFVVLEIKEQLHAELANQVDPHGTLAVYGRDQGERAVELFKLGEGKSSAPSWGTVRLPGCGVESDSFTVKELSEVVRGVDPSTLNRSEFLDMAVAQGRLVAGFQALAGVGHSYGVGNAQDILAHMNAPGRDFVEENVAGAIEMATHWEHEWEQFKSVDFDALLAAYA